MVELWLAYTYSGWESPAVKPDKSNYAQGALVEFVQVVKICLKSPPEFIAMFGSDFRVRCGFRASNQQISLSRLLAIFAWSVYYVVRAPEGIAKIFLSDFSKLEALLEGAKTGSPTYWVGRGGRGSLVLLQQLLRSPEPKTVPGGSYLEKADRCCQNSFQIGRENRCEASNLNSEIFYPWNSAQIRHMCWLSRVLVVTFNTLGVANVSPPLLISRWNLVEAVYSIMPFMLASCPRGVGDLKVERFPESICPHG